MTNSTVTQQKIFDRLKELEQKYFHLVWYARSNPATDLDYWKKQDPKIRQDAFNAQMEVEEKFFDEVVELRDDETNWHHGFNSGMLAGLRYVLTALDDQEIECDGEMTCFGGIENADQEFPFLDT